MEKIISKKKANQILEKVLRENNIEILDEMATLLIGKKSFYKIVVYSGEGEIPHIHFFLNKEDFPNKGGCISLKSAEYANHGSHKDKLTNKQIDTLIDWFKEFDEDDNTKINYQSACYLWNKNNPDYKMILSKDKKEIPDYSRLKK